MSKPVDQSIEIQSAEHLPLFVTASLNIPNYAQSAYLGAPVVADPDRIVTSAPYDNGTLTIAAQPDTPRNITVTVTDANASITAGILTVTGVDPMGNAVVEVMDITDGLTFTGTKMFGSVTSAVITDEVGSQASTTDVIVIGVGNRIALPQDIVGSQAVKHVYLGGARVAAPVVTAGPQISSVDVSAATYNGTKALQVIYSPIQ